MSIERELLEKVISGDNKGDFFVSYDLYKEIYKFLAQHKENYVEMLPSELWLDGYEAGKKSALLSKQPEQEPVAWMWTRNYEGGGYTNKVFEFLNDAEEYAKDSKTLKSPDIIRPLYTTPPKREPIEDGELEVWYSQHTWAMDKQEYMWGFRDAEKAHGIGGEE